MDKMTTVRLPPEVEQKLRSLSALKGKTKSELIKEALEKLFASEETSSDSFELGKEYFGKHGSGQTTRSTEYKRILKDKLSAKHHSH